MILLSIIILLFILYGLLIFYYSQSWKAVPVYVPTEQAPATRISVIIPVRNEEKNIGQLLEALQRQDHPASLIETIVVDDHSADNTGGIVLQYPPVKLISLNEAGINSYKKKAIETG